jgi:putative flavoprotein involved in K+ transport
MNISDWINALNTSMVSNDPSAVGALFTDGGFWRDFLALGWTLQTLEGRAQIEKFVAQTAKGAEFRADSLADADATEGFILFQTKQGRGRGFVRLEDGKCLTLLTVLEELKGHPLPLRERRRSGLMAEPDKGNWKEQFAAKTDAYAAGDDPYVLIVGGGQGGLALGARLEMQGVPYLIIDKHPKVGDQWRSRYKALTLHDPVWYDHMPYMPFPDFWPVFTPKDKMGDWLESYAHALELAIWTNTECHKAERAEDGTWRVTVDRDGQELTLRPTHLVMAVGNAGFPRVPEFEGQDDFAGTQLHSSQYKTGEGLQGKRVIIVGANNSAHDIAADLVQNGAQPVMIQRSSTLIVQQSTVTDVLLKPVFSQDAIDRGISTDLADLLLASTPLRLQERASKLTWENIRKSEAAFYDRLAATGFKLDFGEDGTGMMKYQRSASGYYFDVGACEMIVEGRIGIRSGVNISRLQPDGMELDTGEVIPADMIVYATGFGSMEEWVARLIDADTAQRVGKCWGYGSGAKGDAGPWEGELRNMWKPTAVEGLWFMGGNLAQARFYSNLVALQLKARFEGLLVEVVER